MKILIISSFFPPQNSIASLRPYSWAKHWSRIGHDVTVLTVPKKPSPSNSAMPFEGFNVIEVPIPGMALFSKFLSSSKTRKQHIIQPKDQPQVSPVFSFKRALRQWLGSLQSRYGIAYGCRMPDPLDFWTGAALKALGNQHWDLVVSSAWPYGVHAPAYALKRAGLAKYWIADWRDLWVDNHMFPGLPGFRAIERRLERRWCEMADTITTVSEPLANVLRRKYGNKVEVIYNGFDSEDYATLPDLNAFPDDGIFRILYTGSIYIGQRDPTPLFRALADAAKNEGITPKQIQILFCGANANVNDLALVEGVADFVKYLGFLPRPQALHMQRDASVLLLLEFESKTVKGILTGKLFEYLFAGPPVWAVGLGRDSSIAEVLLSSESGLVLGNDVCLIKKNLLKAISEKNNIINKIYDARIMKYARVTQADKLLKLSGVVDRI